jgi:hypothetical protein
MATTTESTIFARPAYPLRNPAGPTIVHFKQEIPTTNLDLQDDLFKCFKVPDGVRLNYMLVTNEDLDSGGGGALDMDIVLVDDIGTTILYNAGTAFNAAVTVPTFVSLYNVEVVSRGDSTAYVALKVNTAASTAAAGDVEIILFYESAGGV